MIDSLRRFGNQVRSIFTRPSLDEELNEEISSHLEMAIEENLRRGMDPGEAHRQALIRFGGIQQARELQREARGLPWIEILIQDLHFAWRMLLKSPTFMIIAIGSLALGIGVNTAIFSLAKQILFDRLSVPHAQNLQLLTWTAPKHNIVRHLWGDQYTTEGGELTGTTFPYPLFLELRNENRVLGELFAFKDVDRMAATIGGEAVSVQGQAVSGNYFGALEVRPELGRAIQETDDQNPGSGPVVVISDGFWARYFGRSPTVIGQTINLNKTIMTIIGVNPPEFTGAGDAHLSPDVFFPLRMQPILFPRRGGSVLQDQEYWWTQIMARSKSGTHLLEAQSSLDTIFQSIVRSIAKPSHGDGVPRLILADGSRGLHKSAHALAKPVYVLLALAGLVLLLACVNIANLLLARSAARQKEMGVRMALGAGRTRIVRQMLTESLLLSVLGGVAGLALAYAARNVLPGLISSSWRPPVFGGQFDGRVFAFTASVSIITGLIFGMAPARKAVQTDVNGELKEGTISVTPRRRGLAGKMIVGLEIALSTVLVAGAVLFVRTFLNLSATDPGFRTDHLLLFSIELPRSQFPAPNDVAFFRQLEEKLNALSGVAAATTSAEPLIAKSVSMDDFIRLDQPLQASDTSSAWSNAVGSSFFPTMSIPIIAGRGFSNSDSPAGTKVAIINQTLARQFFPGVNPIGKTFRGYYLDEQAPFQIVGICADTRYSSLREPPPATYYVLYSQMPKAGGAMTYEVRTRLSPASMSSEIRHVVRSINQNVPVIDLRTQAEQIEDSIQQERILAGLTASFGVLALVLACIGTYGIMAQSVMRRINEIGIRIALGAQTGQILGMILLETSWLAVAGVAVGLGVASILGGFLKTMLFGMKPYDPVSLAGSGLLLFAVALLAGVIPARRAARVQPMQALRQS